MQSIFGLVKDDRARPVGHLTGNLLADVSGETARTVLGEIPVVHPGPGALAGRCRVLLRPEQLQISLGPGESGTAAEVVEVQYHGHDALAHLRINGDSAPMLLARIPGELELEPGQPVWVAVTSAGRAWPPPSAGRA